MACDESGKVGSPFKDVMERPLSCLHPQPGWLGVGSKDAKTVDDKQILNMAGKHCILELYQCDQIRLNDEAFLRAAMIIAAKSAGAKLLNLITHQFEPYGVTGLALLAESHLSIHTWPEHGYAAIDVFTCGDHTMPEQACGVLCKQFLAKSHSLKSLQRCIPVSLIDSMRQSDSKRTWPCSDLVFH